MVMTHCPSQTAFAACCTGTCMLGRAKGNSPVEVAQLRSLIWHPFLSVPHRIFSSPTLGEYEDVLTAYHVGFVR